MKKIYNIFSSVTLASLLMTVIFGGVAHAAYITDPIDGTANNNTLRWDGSAWVESTALTNDGTDVNTTGDLDVDGQITAGTTGQAITDAAGELAQDDYVFTTQTNILTDGDNVYDALNKLNNAIQSGIEAGTNEGDTLYWDDTAGDWKASGVLKNTSSVVTITGGNAAKALDVADGYAEFDEEASFLNGLKSGGTEFVVDVNGAVSMTNAATGLTINNATDDIFTVDSLGNTLIGGNLTFDSIAFNNAQTAIRATGTADDTSIVTEKAVRDAIDALNFDIAGGVANDILYWDGASWTNVATSGDVTNVAGAFTIADGAIAGAEIAGTAVLADGVTATTQAASDNSTKVSTTAYVDAAIGALPSMVEGTVDNQVLYWDNTLSTWTAVATSGDVTNVAGAFTIADGAITGAEIAGTAVLADGVSATTQAATDNTTAVATTAFVQQEIGALNFDIAGGVANDILYWDGANWSNVATSGDVTNVAGAFTIADGAIAGAEIAGTAVLADGVTATTQTLGDGLLTDGSEKAVATLEYVDDSIGAIVSSTGMAVEVITDIANSASYAMSFMSASAAVQLPSTACDAAATDNGRLVTVKNNGAGVIAVTAEAGTLDGGASFSLEIGDAIDLICQDGATEAWMIK